MLSFSIALALVSPQTPSSHPAVENRGKLGTWYWSTPGKNIPLDDAENEEQLPTLERFGNKAATASRFTTFTTPTKVKSGQFTSVQVNINNLGQNITGDAANEPSLAVDPTNRNKIVVGWRQFDNVSSNFRQAGNGYSLNGGTSWNKRPVFTPGTFRSDPVLASDSIGNFYYNSLQQTFFDDVFASSNSGIDWILKGPATGGDKQWMACDKTQGPGRGFLYQCWSTAGNNYNGRQFSRSVNGGNSWMDPINIPGSPVWGTLDVASNGALYLCGMTNNSFEFCRSSNAQNSGVTPTFDRVVNVNLGGAIVFGAAMNPAGLLGQAWIATDKSNGPNAGNIYMLCSVGVDATNPCQVNFVKSTDGGLTWSAPRTLNTDAPNVGTTHWFGTLSVSPGGRLDVCWNDNRANPASNNSALFYTSSYDGGVTWTPNVQLSPYFNPNIGYPNQNKMGDYIGMVSDTQGANIAYAATFNNEEDIWFLRVPGLIALPANATAINPYQGKRTSGVLSDIWNPDGSIYSMTSSTIPQLGSVVAAETYYTLPATDVGGLAIRVKGTSSVTNTAMVFLWNWQTQAWDYKKSAAWPTGSVNDTTFNFGTNLSPYIYPNGSVRCLVRLLNPARLGASPFNATFDLIRLLYG